MGLCRFIEKEHLVALARRVHPTDFSECIR